MLEASASSQGDIVAQLRAPRKDRMDVQFRTMDALCHEAADEIERLRKALRRLLNDSMYKDHPEASQMAIEALERTK